MLIGALAQVLSRAFATRTTNKASGQIARDKTPRVLSFRLHFRHFRPPSSVPPAIGNVRQSKAKRQVGEDRSPSSFGPLRIGGFGQNSARAPSVKLSKIGVTSCTFDYRKPRDGFKHYSWPRAAGATAGSPSSANHQQGVPPDSAIGYNPCMPFLKPHRKLVKDIGRQW